MTPHTDSWPPWIGQALVDSGKVKAIGISETTLEDAKKIHSVVPISAIELEWSLFNRDGEVQFLFLIGPPPSDPHPFIVPIQTLNDLLCSYYKQYKISVLIWWWYAVMSEKPRPFLQICCREEIEVCIWKYLWGKGNADCWGFQSHLGRNDTMG